MILTKCQFHFWMPMVKWNSDVAVFYFKISSIGEKETEPRASYSVWQCNVLVRYFRGTIVENLPHGRLIPAYPVSFWHTLWWRHNGRDSASSHPPHGCLLNCLFRRRSKKTSKLCVTGLSAWNSPGTGEFPTQMASNAENISIWWSHHGYPGILWFHDEDVNLWWLNNLRVMSLWSP